MPYLALIVLPASLVAAEDWPPITSEVWAMREDPAAGIKGAVILEDRISFNGSYVEYVHRTRILTEAGRAAAEVRPFSEDCYDIQGRTVYRDGRSVVFNKRKDFQTKDVVEVRGESYKQTTLVPPGVTGDCVVELRWRESAANEWGSPLPRRMAYMGQWRFSSQYKILLSSVELPEAFAYAYQVMPSRSHTPEVVKRGSTKTFIFRDLPAQEEVPFTLAVTRDAPRLLVYYQPEVLNIAVRKGPDAYWKEVVQSYYRGLFDRDVKRGKDFARLADELTQALPSTGPTALAGELYTRLQGRIHNAWASTAAEAALRAKDQKPMEAKDLNAAARAGETNAQGMAILFFQLLKAAGLVPKLALVADRDQHIFTYELLSVFQFTDVLVGVEEPGKGTVWFNPGFRFAAPGLVHPDYQGTPALEIDSRDWSFRQAQIPAQQHLVNQTRLEYRLTLEEEEDQFTLQANYSGYPEFRERSKYFKLEAAEQGKALKEELERAFKDVTYTRAEVLNALDPRTDLVLKVEGRVERAAGRRRTGYPFPSMFWPIWVPDALPERRVDPILISYRRAHIATSRFKVPKGFRPPAVPPAFDRSNSFGSVKWAAAVEGKGEEREVVVMLRVDITGFLFGPEAYGQLKEFLGWVRDVCGRTLGLEKA